MHAMTLDMFGGAPETTPVAAEFFNTAALRGDPLAGVVAAAGRQDAAVLAIFHRFDRPLAPSDVWRFGCDGGSHWLLTSVRRSINTLTRAGMLAKLDARKCGPYGRPELTWRLS